MAMTQRPRTSSGKLDPSATFFRQKSANVAHAMPLLSPYNVHVVLDRFLIFLGESTQNPCYSPTKLVNTT